jgi:hypothetical protein
MAQLLQIFEPGETPVPHQGDTELAIGIDLGTTNSVVAISSDNKVEVLTDADGRALVPSVVAYAPDGSAIVGDLAKRLLLSRPDSVVSSIKRLMGRGAEDVKTLGGQLPFDIEPHVEGQSHLVRLNIGGHKLTRAAGSRRRTLGREGAKGRCHRARLFRRCPARRHQGRRASGGAGGVALGQRAHRSGAGVWLG